MGQPCLIRSVTWLSVQQAADYCGVDHIEMYQKMPRNLEIRRMSMRCVTPYGRLSHFPPWGRGGRGSRGRVEPSTSVNKNVTTPEGAAALGADTPAVLSQSTRSYLAHRQNPTPHIRARARRNALPVGRVAAAIWHTVAGQR